MCTEDAARRGGRQTRRRVARTIIIIRITGTKTATRWSNANDNPHSRPSIKIASDQLKIRPAQTGRRTIRHARSLLRFTNLTACYRCRCNSGRTRTTYGIVVINAEKLEVSHPLPPQAVYRAVVSRTDATKTISRIIIIIIVIIRRSVRSSRLRTETTPVALSLSSCSATRFLIGNQLKRTCQQFDTQTEEKTSCLHLANE